MRIAILGTGGVGGYFGGRLAAAGADVSFVARGAHLAALRERGLRILSPAGDVHLPAVRATDDPGTIGPVDIVFFTVKLYDTESALLKLPPLIGPDTLVIPFQNGVESIDVLARVVGHEHVAGGTCYVSAVIAEPGVIQHTAMGRLIFGTPGAPAPRSDFAGALRPAPSLTPASSPASAATTRHPAPQLDALLEACRGAGFESVLSDHIMIEIWLKFAQLSVFSGLTAAARCPIGVIINDPDLAAMMADALRESFAVAQARGIALPQDKIDKIMAAHAALPAGAKSSMLEDLERGRPLELPFLSGAIVRFGRELGVDTPTHRFMAAVLKPHVGGRGAV
jgi:2-dehydropantoate 2-reductase